MKQTKMKQFLHNWVSVPSLSILLIFNKLRNFLAANNLAGCMSFVLCSVAWSTSVLGQCPKLDEPLFLQAPDSICSTKKELVVKTSRIAISGVKYFWRTPFGDTITTDTTLRILSPNFRHSGNYSVAVMVDTCRSALFGPVNVQVISVAQTRGDTIKTVISCNSSEITIASTYQTTASVTGEWRGTEGVTFSPPNARTTVIKGLQTGGNLAIWTLSTAICPAFFRDTFLVRKEIAPQIQTDAVVLRVGEASKTINLARVAGSNLDLLKDVIITITKPPRNGTLEKLNDGKRLRYVRGAAFKGQDAFEVKVCNLQCANLCSVPVGFSIDVQFDDRYPNVTIPKMLTPQQTGEGQLFKIERIENYPENILTILNRWGNPLITFTNYTNQTPWNGSTEKGELPGGAYYYRFEAKKDIASPDGKPLRPLTGIFYVVN